LEEEKWEREGESLIGSEGERGKEGEVGCVEVEFCERWRNEKRLEVS
jgi:hypothetical protein